jgi:hypothetical protein
MDYDTEREQSTGESADPVRAAAGRTLLQRLQEQYGNRELLDAMGGGAGPLGSALLADLSAACGEPVPSAGDRRTWVGDLDAIIVVGAERQRIVAAAFELARTLVQAGRVALVRAASGDAVGQLTHAFGGAGATTREVVADVRRPVEVGLFQTPGVVYEFPTSLLEAYAFAAKGIATSPTWVTPAFFAQSPLGRAQTVVHEAVHNSTPGGLRPLWTPVGAYRAAIGLDCPAASRWIRRTGTMNSQRYFSYCPGRKPSFGAFHTTGPPRTRLRSPLIVWPYSSGSCVPAQGIRRPRPRACGPSGGHRDVHAVLLGVLGGPGPGTGRSGRSATA